MRTDSKIKAEWFLPRTRDSPLRSAIQLGAIIESPLEPERKLNKDPPPDIPTHLTREPRTDPNWSWTKEFEYSAGGGVFASFLQLVGIGAEFSHDVARSHSEIYDAERLVTTEFLPDADYLKESLNDEGVQEILVGPMKRSQLFMVTGLKIAYGATKALSGMRSHETHAHVGIDPIGMGSQLTVGPKGHYSSKVTEKLTTGPSDFVFGFKLRVIKNKQGQMSHEKFDAGALFDAGGETEEEDIDRDAFAFEDTVEEYIGEFEMQSKEITVSAGGKVVQCFFE